MPLRSPKMKRFIFGFQRRVWWPKWTRASSSCFMVTTGSVTDRSSPTVLGTWPQAPPEFRERPLEGAVQSVWDVGPPGDGPVDECSDDQAIDPRWPHHRSTAATLDETAP